MTALPDAWASPVADGPVVGRVEVPGSKSQTNRLLVLAALSPGHSRLVRPLRSRDTMLMAGALRALGVAVSDDGEDWVVEAPDVLRAGAGTRADCGNAGTVARFVPPLAALAVGDVILDGDVRMRARPLTPLVDALRHLGAQVSGDRVPLTVHGTGRLRGGSVGVDASSSSQLVSGLLLSAPRYDQGVEVIAAGPVPSAPHITMTLRSLVQAGARVEVPRPGVWRVAPGPLRPGDRSVEPDVSSASAFLAAAAATGGTVDLAGWPEGTAQPGRLLPGLLEAFGCRCEVVDGDLRVTGPDRLHGADLDLSDYGEVAPTLTALAVLADSPSRLRGIAHLRLQETDRLAALAGEMGRLGARVQETDDGLAVTPAPLHGARLDPHADHRLAMAFAVVGLVVPGVEVLDVGTTAKTVPGFADRWSRLVAGAPAGAGAA